MTSPPDKPSVELIGPEEALELVRGIPLGYAAGYVRMPEVAMLAVAMREGEWEHGADERPRPLAAEGSGPILVAEDGGALTGVTVLLAVILANTSVKMVVRRGVRRPPEFGERYTPPATGTDQTPSSVATQTVSPLDQSSTRKGQ